MFANCTRSGVGVALVALMAGPVFSQAAVTGTVRGERSQPLAGVAIQIGGTRDRSLTDAVGRYRVEIPRAVADTTDSVTIIVRSIGFRPVTRRVALGPAGVTADFVLDATSVTLDEVVVTGAASAGDAIARRGAKDGPRAMPGRVESAAAEARDARAPASPTLAKARSDASRVGRGAPKQVDQEPRPGVLTAAVWDDAEHWPQYLRFLGRASESSWNPWGLDVGRNDVRPVRAYTRPLATRRALNLGFLVDATGSMGDEMTFLQSELKDIVRRVRALEPELDIRMSVVFYRDRGDTFITKSLPFTRSVDDAVAFIAGTTADGGGDYPEDMNAGLDAMLQQRWSRDGVPQMLFLLADAPPHQYPGEDYTYHEAIRDAAANGIAIYPVAASGVDKPTEFLFRAMAVMTGGKYVFLTDDSGVGNSHEEPDITGYTVEKLNDLMVREIRSYVATHTGARKVAEGR